MTRFLIVLLVFQFKHFLCDFIFQGRYMLGKFKEKGWVLPLVAHCAVHFAFTLAIALVVRPTLWWLAFVDFTVHFCMDRIKADKNLLGRFEVMSRAEFMKAAATIQDTADVPDGLWQNLNRISALKKIKSNTWYFYALGIDQTAHHITDLMVAYFLCVGL